MLMRDPWLGQGPDGVWHMVWTWGWAAKDMGGKLKIGYSSSKDLIHWSPQRALYVMENEPAARNLWAPEAVWDAAHKEWIVFWASTIPGRFPDTEGTGDTGYNHRIYATTTKDWQTFSPAELWFDPGFNCIDTTVVHAGSRWILVFKDERKNPQVKKLRLAFADSPAGPWKDVTEPFSGDWVEGPLVAETRRRVVALLRPLHGAAALRRDAHQGLEELRGYDAAGVVPRRSPSWHRGEDPGRTRAEAAGCDALSGISPSDSH